jgi:hypothetical protein
MQCFLVDGYFLSEAGKYHKHFVELYKKKVNAITEQNTENI